ncbi:ABC transporter ATP-binding protein [Nocardia carnea]|uniref:ABC transporter ATP-binding protein n=1 Tax=Nocardia carnea TaxID=37328 RepID=UPI002456BDC6|nr:ATP-binding cassette domain-containing protein [Nocardia carnea]
MADALISVRNLSARAGTSTVLRAIDFDLGPGQILTLFGPSGAGKTTLAAAVAGVDRPGIDVSGAIRRAPALRIGYLPQYAAGTLNPARRIGAALGELVTLQHRRAGGGRLRAATRRDRVTRMLATVAIGTGDRDGVLGKYPFEFSGGERARLALAQVLVCEPHVLVVDEPTVGLDSLARSALLTALRDLRYAGKSVLLVTHDPHVVEQLSDRTLFVSGGRLVEPEPDPGPAPAGLAGPRRETRSAPALRVRGLAAGPRRTPILRDIDLDLYPGEMLGLIGVSGAGKSTLARCIAGLARPVAGDIRADGESLPVLRRRTRYQIAHIQYVWQESAASFDPHRDVLDQVSATGIRLRGMSRTQARSAATTLLADLGIDEAQAARLPAGLSGGQLQRAALARALLARPRILLCDEVTTALDKPTAGLILDHLDDYRRATDAAVLWIGHDLRSQFDRADRIAVLDGGRITDIGPPAALTGGSGPEILARLVQADSAYGRVPPAAS